MVIYNVTIKVAWQIADEWLQWMQQTHMPGMMASGCFVSHQLVRLLDIDEAEGPTYAAQFTAHSKQQIDDYLEQYSPTLRQQGYDKWGDQFIAYRTIMQVVQ
ncbi:DUF4286 family protein [Aridibaculum aurantiacum]|uniref:DUF4286 family protein n=1 Tax=Aridibaculum aurantiacum TaxID=2810307 RepID=UPI001A95FBFD|nr:DUF4286 family protein [Aridibaculum aurantiacum]